VPANSGYATGAAPNRPKWLPFKPPLTLSKGGYIRALVLGCPGPRSQRAPSVNAQALAKATAALNKVGSNLNQIARGLNAGGAHMTTRDCRAAIEEVRTALTCILGIVGRAGRDDR